MKHHVLDALVLYNAFVAGGNEVIRRRDAINRINVFPVADGDTGTNLAMTMRSFINNCGPLTTAGQTLQSIADAALSGARGNSGIIFAQFFAGLSEIIQDIDAIPCDLFLAAARNAEQRAREAVLAPVEGTILTVMKDWVRQLEEHCHLHDFALVFHGTLKGTQQSLDNTPNYDNRMKIKLTELKMHDSGGSVQSSLFKSQTRESIRKFSGEITGI